MPLAVFHTARTLSGSLCSPPSPRGKGYVSGIAASSYRSLPHWGRGTASAVDRVLSYIACLRRSSPLFFIPLVPYPARFARHLPHAGKALCRGQRHPHPTSAPSGHLLPMEGGNDLGSPFPWKGLPSAARRGWLPFFAAKPPPLSLPHWGRGTA